MRSLIILICIPLFFSLAKAQDASILCVRRNLLVPEGFLKLPSDKQELECAGVNSISESNAFLFTGFEDYGYILEVDTIGYAPYIWTSAVGYCNLVNNTDSSIIIGGLTYSIDNMAITIAENRPSIEITPGQSIRLRYELAGALFRINNRDFLRNFYSTNKDSLGINRTVLLNKELLLDILLESDCKYEPLNRITLYYGERQRKVLSFSVRFIIPVNYVKAINFI